MEHAAPTTQHQTTTGLDSRKLMMWAFLGSDTLFFGALIATYLLYRREGLPGPSTADLFNTLYPSGRAFVLLMSILTMVLALSAIQRGDLRGLKIWLLATALLGTIFVGGQYFEFIFFWHEGLTLTNNLFGATFYVLTGIHGLHVTIGIIILLSFYIMALRGKLKPEQHLNIELAGLYWHFVDVVWIVIFTVVYLIEAPNIVT